MLYSLFERLYDLIMSIVPKLPAVLLTVLIGYILIRIAQYFAKKIFRLCKFNKAMSELLLSLTNVFLWILFAAEVARELGLSDVAIAISGSAIAFGFAIANGASAVASDVIAGFSLARDKDFEVGYRIKVGDIEGIVERIDIRKVRIKSGDGKINVVPNSKIDNANGWTILDRN